MSRLLVFLAVTFALISVCFCYTRRTYRYTRYTRYSRYSYGSSGGYIAGYVFAGLIGLGLLAFLLIFCFKLLNRKKQTVRPRQNIAIVSGPPPGPAPYLRPGGFPQPPPYPGPPAFYSTGPRPPGQNKPMSPPPPYNQTQLKHRSPGPFNTADPAYPPAGNAYPPSGNAYPPAGNAYPPGVPPVHPPPQGVNEASPTSANPAETSNKTQATAPPVSSAT